MRDVVLIDFLIGNPGNPVGSWTVTCETKDTAEKLAAMFDEYCAYNKILGGEVCLLSYVSGNDSEYIVLSCTANLTHIIQLIVKRHPELIIRLNFRITYGDNIDWDVDIAPYIIRGNQKTKIIHTLRWHNTELIL